MFIGIFARKIIGFKQEKGRRQNVWIVSSQAPSDTSFVADTLATVFVARGRRNLFHIIVCFRRGPLAIVLELNAMFLSRTPRDKQRWKCCKLQCRGPLAALFDSLYAFVADPRDSFLSRTVRDENCRGPLVTVFNFIICFHRGPFATIVTRGPRRKKPYGHNAYGDILWLHHLLIVIIIFSSVSLGFWVSQIWQTWLYEFWFFENISKQTCVQWNFIWSSSALHCFQVLLMTKSQPVQFVRGRKFPLVESLKNVVWQFSMTETMFIGTYAITRAKQPKITSWSTKWWIAFTNISSFNNRHVSR